MQIRINCPDAESTVRLGEKIGAVIVAGTVIAASGELGAGKTLFAAALARGLGVKELVVSPTFIYYQRYQGRLSFCHIDAYRLENMSLEDQEQLGLIDCFGEQDVAVVEWPEYAAEFLPIDTIRLTIRRLQQEEREFIFDFDAKAHDWLREVLK